MHLTFKVTEFRQQDPTNNRSVAILVLHENASCESFFAYKTAIMSANATSFLRYGVHRLDAQNAHIADEVCPICYDRLGESVAPVQIIACHHHFCSDCLTAHINARRRNRNTCPLCRAQLFTRDLYRGRIITTRRAIGDRAAGEQTAFDEISDPVHRPVIVEERDVTTITPQAVLDGGPADAFLGFLVDDSLLDELDNRSSDEELANAWSGSEDDYLEDIDVEEQGEHDAFDEDGEYSILGEDAIRANFTTEAGSNGPEDDFIDLPFSIPTRQQATASRPGIGFDDNERRCGGSVRGLPLRSSMDTLLRDELAEFRHQLAALDARATQLQNDIRTRFSSSSIYGSTVQLASSLSTRSVQHEFLPLHARMDALEAAERASRLLRSNHRVASAGIFDSPRRPARHGRSGLDRPGVHLRRRFIAHSSGLESDSDGEDGSDSDCAEGSQLGVLMGTDIEAMSETTSAATSNSSSETDPDKYDEDDSLQVTHSARCVPAADAMLGEMGEDDDEEDSDHFEEYYGMMDVDADTEGDDELSDDDMDVVFEN